jgi:hypothetical protein
VRILPCVLMVFGATTIGCNGSRSNDAAQRTGATESEEAPSELKTHIRREAEAMFRAFQAGDIDSFLQYCPDEMIEMAGGREQLASLVRQDPLQGKGEIRSQRVLDVSDVVAEESGELAAFVTIRMDFDLVGEQYTQHSYYVAVSDDSGKSWKFWSGQNDDQKVLFRQWFPRLTSTTDFPRYSFGPTID